MDFNQTLQLLESETIYKIKQIVTLEGKKYIIGHKDAGSVTLIPVGLNSDTGKYEMSKVNKSEGIPIDEYTPSEYDDYSGNITIGIKNPKYQKINLSEEVEDVDKKILDMWSTNYDLKLIVKLSGKDKSYIKNLLKTQNRKGWDKI